MRFLFLIGICCVLSGGVLSAQKRDSVYFRAEIWDSTIERFKAQDAVDFPEKGGILFVGSSSFTRWDNLEDYFPNHRVFNRGFGGSHLSDIIYYAEDIVFPYHPGQIVLYEGDNDMSSGLMTPETYLDEVKTFIRLVEIRMPGVPVLIVSTKSCPSRDRFRKDYERINALVYDYCRTKKQVKFVDVASLMLDEHGDYILEDYVEDLLHVSVRGYKKWAQAIEPYLIK